MNASEQFAPEDRPVRRRHVFYISGFDPKGPAWYHELFSAEAAKQAAVSGYRLDVGPRGRSGKYVARWQTSWNGGETETTYDFLRWDDIMRRHWPRGSFAMFGVMLGVYANYIANGILRRTLRNTWATFITGTYPAVFFSGLALAAVLLAATGWFAGGPTGLVIGAIAGLALVHFGAPWLEKAFGVLWLIRIYAFTLLQARKAVPGLDERLDLFAEHVSIESRKHPDEIVIAGHSTGAQLAASFVARLIARDPQLPGRTRLGLLTLGGSLPMLGWQAPWFRDEIQTLADVANIDWIDVTAAQDGATFALLDPLKLMDLRPVENRPKLISAKLFDLFAPESFARIRRDWRRVHFQYLMASERAAGYDYFAIVAGPRTLAQRFAHRASPRSFDRFKLKMFRR